MPYAPILPIVRLYLEKEKEKKSMNIIKISLLFFIEQSCVTMMQIGARTHAQERAHFFFFFLQTAKIGPAGSVKHEID